METLIFLGAMVGLFYFVLIRPQQNRIKAHRALIRSLEVGDMVVMSSGIHGAVALIDATEKIVWLEVAPNLELKFSMSSVSERVDDSEIMEVDDEDDESEANDEDSR